MSIAFWGLQGLGCSPLLWQPKCRKEIYERSEYGGEGPAVKFPAKVILWRELVHGLKERAE